MLNQLFNVLTTGGTSALSALLVCFVMRQLYRQGEDQRKKTEDALLKAKEERWEAIRNDVEELKTKLDSHIAADQTQVIMNELRNISGNISKLLDQQTTLIQSDAEQRSQIVTLFKMTRDQKENLKECQKEHKA